MNAKTCFIFHILDVNRPLKNEYNLCVKVYFSGSAAPQKDLTDFKADCWMQHLFSPSMLPRRILEMRYDWVKLPRLLEGEGEVLLRATWRCAAVVRVLERR